MKFTGLTTMLIYHLFLIFGVVFFDLNAEGIFLLYTLEALAYMLLGMITGPQYLGIRERYFQGMELRANILLSSRAFFLAFSQIFFVFSLLLFTIYVVGLDSLETIYIPASLIGVSYLWKFAKFLLSGERSEYTMRKWTLREFLPLILFFTIVILGGSEIYFYAVLIFLILKGIIDVSHEWYALEGAQKIKAVSRERLDVLMVVLMGGVVMMTGVAAVWNDSMASFYGGIDWVETILGVLMLMALSVLFLTKEK